MVTTVLLLWFLPRMPPPLAPPLTATSLPHSVMVTVLPLARATRPAASPLLLLVPAAVPCTTTPRISASFTTPNRPAYWASAFIRDTV